jgi:Histidine kinase/Y_Y_Y domain/Two component regulator propeller
VTLDFIHTTGNQFWGGTNQGLIKLKDTSSLLRELLLSRAGKPFIPDECTDFAIAKSGRMYATYGNNGLVEIEKDRKAVSIFSIPAPAKLYVYEVCEDKGGQLWIGTSKGVFLFDTGSKKFSQPSFLPIELRNMHINVIFCDHSGDIWIGTRSPFVLFRADAIQKCITKVTDPVIDQFAALYADSRVSAITEDKRNNLWMTSYLGGGIINFNKTSGLWKIYPAGGHHKSLLVDRGLLSLYADENYNLWSYHFYENSGLIRYNYITDSLRQFTRDDGLTSDYIDNMVSDQSNNLWICSEHGITQFNIQNDKAISFRPHDIPGTMLEREGLFDAVTNNLVYASEDRLLFIEISQLKKDTTLIIPYIDRITVNNKELFIDPATQKPGLNYDENNISIEFTGVDFSNAQSVNFAYQLSGLDTGWRFSDASRSAQYANLAPGHYIFKIKTADENKEWSEVYEVFSFTIIPAFWQTNLFRLSVLFFIAFLVFWFVRRRIRTIRREAGLKLKLSETEMMALRSQMNPHFIFNCLNAIDNLIQTSQTDKATTYLARFAKLIRSVLESSKNNLVPFDKDFETLALFLELEQFRCNKKFTYEMRPDKELLEGDYKVPPLLIQPFVENAIHHGLLNKETGERKLVIKASLENNFITYIVQDNGVGRKKAQEIKELNKPEHQSYGIQITSERIHLHNQNSKMDDIVITDLTGEDGPGGTTVKVKLKIQ